MTEKHDGDSYVVSQVVAGADLVIVLSTFIPVGAGFDLSQTTVLICPAHSCTYPQQCFRTVSAAEGFFFCSDFIDLLFVLQSWISRLRS